MPKLRSPSGTPLAASLTRVREPEPETMLDVWRRVTETEFPELADIRAFLMLADVGIDLTPEQMMLIAHVTAKGIDAGRQEAGREPLPTISRPKPRDDSDPVSVVYFLRNGDHVKIGTTTQHISARMSQMQLPPGALVVGIIPRAGRMIEAELHQRFAASRITGEWFASTPELEALIATFPA